jgi:hypothetical protein
MPPRAAVFQAVQVGLEATPGTPVAASKRLLATEIALQPRTPFNTFRPVGQKFATGSSAQKEWTEASVRGALSYNDLTYIMSSLLTQAAVPGTWTLKPNTFGPDNPATYTIMSGSSAGAESVAYGLFQGIDMRMTRAEAALTGSILGKVLNEQITMTASPTDIPKALINPKSIDVFMSDTLAAIGSGKVTNSIEAGLSFGNRYAGFFPFDSTEASYSGHVERAPSFTCHLTAMHDSISAGWAADMRAQKTKFVRWLSNGPLVIAGGGIFYKMQITMAFQFRQPDRGPREELWTSAWPGDPVYDSTLGGAIEVVLVNDVAAL